MESGISITRRGILSSAGALGVAAAAGATLGGALPAAGAAAYEEASGDALIGKVKAPDLHVMSFNIRYDREGTQPGQPDYWPPSPTGNRIDWILTTPGITVKEAAINTWTKDGRWPSDHAPVQALVRLP